MMGLFASVEIIKLHKFCGKTKQDSYPLPCVETLFYKVSRGKIFSKLDFCHAYLQIELDNELKKFTTIY